MENLCFYLIFKCKVKTLGKKYKQLEKQKTYWSSIHLNYLTNVISGCFCFSDTGYCSSSLALGKRLQLVFNPFFKKVSHQCFINDSTIGSSCQTIILTNFAHNPVKHQRMVPYLCITPGYQPKIDNSGQSVALRQFVHFTAN